MDKPISRELRITFLVHAVIALIFGLSTLFIPGRSLTLMGWVPEWVQLPNSDLSIPGQTFVDPLITRLMGAALLALAYLSFRCWQGAVRTWGEALLVLEFEAVYCALSVVAFIIALITIDRTMPFIGWLDGLLFLAFFVVWGLFWQRARQATR